MVPMIFNVTLYPKYSLIRNPDIRIFAYKGLNFKVPIIIFLVISVEYKRSVFCSDDASK